MNSGRRPPYAGTRYPRLVEVEAFTRLMATGWAPREVPVVLPAGTAAAAAAHRDRLSAALPGATVVIAAGPAPDGHAPFEPDRNLVWLTGCDLPDACLVLTPRPGGHDATLYLPVPLGPGTDGFFGDPTRGELWTGPLPGLAQWADALGIETADPAALDTRADLTGALAGAAVPDDLVARHGMDRSTELARELSVLRMVKDEWEVDQLRGAVAATVDGFAAVVAQIPRAIGDGRGERWLQATFERHARTVGHGPAYPPIVGSGAHASVLHWERCDGPVEADSPVLLDMGVAARSRYCADLTRTIPASGTFGATARSVHDLVERAHRAAMAQVRAGTEYLDLHFAAMEVLARGLHDWGLLPVSVDEALSPDGQHHRRWVACGTTHHLGLDVHDAADAEYADYHGAPLAPGMVLTVEPGLYFHPDDRTVPPELRGIGVRIEDDLLVTTGDPEVLSAALPIDADGVAAWAAACWTDSSPPAG